MAINMPEENTSMSYGSCVNIMISYDDWTTAKGDVITDSYRVLDINQALKEMIKIDNYYNKFVKNVGDNINGQRNIIKARLSSKAIVLRQLRL